jgi:pyruvate,orthophosphate dikinase
MHAFKVSHLEEDIIGKKEKMLKKVRALDEVNPMLGHRGVRLGITYPEIYSMQIQAILEAARCAPRKASRSIPRSWCRRWPRWRSCAASTAMCSACTRWSS